MTRKKKKMYDKILMLARSKLNSIETLISQALIDMDISHEEFITVLKEKDIYDMMKDNLRDKNGESYEIIKFNSKKPKNQASLKKKFFFVYISIYIYIMYLVSSQGYINAGVDVLKIRKTGEIWPNMKDIESGLRVTNISDLVMKEIRGIYEKKELTKEEIKNYKMTEREIYKKFDNLSKDE